MQILERWCSLNRMEYKPRHISSVQYSHKRYVPNINPNLFLCGSYSIPLNRKYLSRIGVKYSIWNSYQRAKSVHSTRTTFWQNPKRDKMAVPAAMRWCDYVTSWYTPVLPTTHPCNRLDQLMHQITLITPTPTHPITLTTYTPTHPITPITPTSTHPRSALHCILLLLIWNTTHVGEGRLTIIYGAFDPCNPFAMDTSMKAPTSLLYELKKTVEHIQLPTAKREAVHSNFSRDYLWLITEHLLANGASTVSNYFLTIEHTKLDTVPWSALNFTLKLSTSDSVS